MQEAVLMTAAAIAIRWVVILVLGLVALIRADKGKVHRVADAIAEWFRLGMPFRRRKS